MLSNELILLTPAFRLDNIPKIEKNVKEIAKDNPNILFIWIVIEDRYNSFGDYDLTDLSSRGYNNLVINIESSGKPHQKNYGGDLFNEPLERILKSPVLHTDDPWVYILDDDNFIHPFLPKILVNDRVIKSGAKIIWTTRIRETGIVDQADRIDALHEMELPTGRYFTPQQLTADPSQVIIKSSLLKNGYGNGFHYDHEWLYPFLQEHLGEIIFHNEWEDDIDKIHSYHNAIRTPEDIASDMYDIDNKVTAQYFCVECIDEGRVPHVYPVSKELSKKILELIQEEIND